MAYRQSALTSFIAYAVGHNVGFAASGGTIRYRMYSLLGFSSTEITRLIIITTVTFAVGASLLLGFALWLMPLSQTAILKLNPLSLHVLSALLIDAPLAYLLLVSIRRAPVTIGPLPRCLSASWCSWPVWWCRVPCPR